MISGPQAEVTYQGSSIPFHILLIFVYQHTELVCKLFTLILCSLIVLATDLLSCGHQKKVQLANLTKARQIFIDQKAALSSESASEILWDALQFVNSRIEKLETSLSQKTLNHEIFQSKLSNYEEKFCISLSRSLQVKVKQQDTHYKLHMQCQIAKRAGDKQIKLAKQIADLKEVEKGLSVHLVVDAELAEKNLSLISKINEDLKTNLTCSMSKWSKQLLKAQLKLEKSQTHLMSMGNKMTSLCKFKKGAADNKERAIAKVQTKMKKERSEHQLMSKGIFTEDTRNLVRLLVKASCSWNYINEVITATLALAGIASYMTGATLLT